VQSYLAYHQPNSSTMAASKYLTGDQKAIDEFIDRFDVR
jgi:hypothetical protein